MSVCVIKRESVHRRRLSVSQVKRSGEQPAERRCRARTGQLTLNSAHSRLHSASGVEQRSSYQLILSFICT